jgi:hypothetical protein
LDVLDEFGVAIARTRRRLKGQREKIGLRLHQHERTLLWLRLVGHVPNLTDAVDDGLGFPLDRQGTAPHVAQSPGGVTFASIQRSYAARCGLTRASGHAVVARPPEPNPEEDQRYRDEGGDDYRARGACQRTASSSATESDHDR